MDENVLLSSMIYLEKKYDFHGYVHSYAKLPKGNDVFLSSCSSQCKMHGHMGLSVISKKKHEDIYIYMSKVVAFSIFNYSYFHTTSKVYMEYRINKITQLYNYIHIIQYDTCYTYN